MIGAILGDMIGSPYEFDRGSKSKEFPLFSGKSVYTDDTVMTLAVCRAFLDVKPEDTRGDFMHPCGPYASVWKEISGCRVRRKIPAVAAQSCLQGISQSWKRVCHACVFYRLAV